MSRSEHEMRQLDQEYGRVEDRRQERVANAKREPAHTPGPWTINAAHPLWVRCMSGHVVAEAPADFVRHKGSLIAEANARLIAVTPELFTELEMAQRHIKHLLEMVRGFRRKERAEIEAITERNPVREAAIQKAHTGQNQSSDRGRQ